jgi:hypothetical protein
MPIPNENESQTEFISRCIPVVLEEGTVSSTEQATAVCYNLWRENKGDKQMENETLQKKMDVQIDVKGIDEDNRVITFRVTKRVVDRDGDLLEPSGMITDDFEKNPVFLPHHEHRSYPLGKVIKIKKTNQHVDMDVQFAGLEELSVEAEQAYRLYKGGFMNAVSIGFMFNKEAVEYPEKMVHLGKKVKRIINKYDMIELSGVTVPSNQDALAVRKAFEAKEITEEDLKLLIGEEAPAEEGPTIEELKKLLEEKDDKIAELEFQLEELEEEKPKEKSIYDEILSGVKSMGTEEESHTSELDKYLKSLGTEEESQTDVQDDDLNSWFKKNKN